MYDEVHVKKDLNRENSFHCQENVMVLCSIQQNMSMHQKSQKFEEHQQKLSRNIQIHHHFHARDFSNVYITILIRPVN